MNPEERRLLERTLKLSEENNEILRKMRRAARWAIIWSVAKLVIIAIPFLIAYFYLEPHFGSISTSFQKLQDLLGI